MTVMQLPAGKVRFDLIPFQTQKRPYDRFSDRPDRTHPFDPAAPEKMKQHRFRPVVCIMGNGNPALCQIRALFSQRLLKCPVTQHPSRFLQRHAIGGGVTFHIHFAQYKRNSQISAQFLHISGILSRFCTNAVIHMHRQQAETSLPGQSVHHVQQTDGIRSAGHSYGNQVPVLYHMMLFNIILHFCIRRIHLLP